MDTCSDIQRIRKILNKKNIYLLEVIQPYYKHEAKSKAYRVIFEDKDKVKIGIMFPKYCHRYGITTEMVFVEGKKYPAWNNLSSKSDKFLENIISYVEHKRYQQELEKFDLDTIEIKW